MQDTGISRQLVDSAYQNKVEVDYPTVEISAKKVTELQTKQINALFPVSATVRVVGIQEKEIGGGSKETIYTLEVRELGVLDKDVDVMSPDELKDHIEQTTEETIE